MQLRPYQKDLVTDTRKALTQHNRIITTLATGGGKTVVFSHIVNNALKKGSKVLVLTDRIELLKQAKKSLDANCDVMMVETLNRRLNTINLYSYNLVIIDECHKRAFDKITSKLSKDTYLIGFTATPFRSGKKQPLKDYYSKIVEGVSIGYLIKNGYLSTCNYYGSNMDLNGIKQLRGEYDPKGVAKMYDNNKVFNGVISNYKRIGELLKTLVFCSTIESSKQLVSEFIKAGYNAKHMDAKSSNRSELLEWFKNTPDAILSNVGILNTGFDEPTIRNVILYRVTRSLPLYLQMVGRGSRTTKTKKEFNLLDFGNNIARFGFWHIDRDWTLETAKPKPVGAMVLKNCKGCNSFIPVSASICKLCGYKYTKLIKEQEFKQLQKLDPKELRKQAAAGGVKKLAEYSKLKLINSRWAMHQIKTKKEAKEFIKLMGYKANFYNVNKSLFNWV